MKIEISKEDRKKLFKDLVCVCVQHPEIEMKKTEVKERQLYDKDHKPLPKDTIEGVFCPKCYCATGRYITRKYFETLKKEKNE